MAIGLSHLVLPQSKLDAQNPPEPLPHVPKTSPSLPVTLHTPEGVGNAFINSDLTEVPETTNDEALARELAKSDDNQRESTMHDEHLAKNMAASEAR